MQNKKLPIAAAALLLLAFVTSLWLTPANNVQAAPNAAVTPVSYSGTGGTNQKVTFFNGSITADTRICVDLSNFNKIDLQYIIDQGTVNTTTLKLQWSNEGTATTNNFEDTATVVSANAADTHAGAEYVVVGQWDCVFADVTNSNALGLKVFGVTKP